MSKSRRRPADGAELHTRAAVTPDAGPGPAQQKAEQRARETSALNTLIRHVSANLSLDKVVHAALEGITTAIAPDVALLFLKEGDALVLHGVHTRGPAVHQDDPRVRRVGECLCGLAIKEGQALYSRNVPADSRCTRDECRQAGLISFAALPLHGATGVFGALGLASSTTERDFAEQATVLDTLSNEIAIGLQNALLYEDVRRNSAALARRNEELQAEIAERSRAEEALRESRERLRQLVENLSEVLWLTDWTTRTLLYVSPSYETVYGRSRQSLFENRRSWIETIHPEDRARVDRIFAEKGERGEYTEEVYRIVRPDGAIRWLRDRSFPIRDEQGRVVRWVGVAEDITAAKEAEEALRSTTERLGLIARTTAAVVGAVPLAEQAREMARQVRAAFNVDACVIRILDGEDLVLLASNGLSEEVLQPRFPAVWGIGGKILAERRPIFVANVYDDSGLNAIAHSPSARFQFRSYAGAPLLLGGRVIGILGIYKKEELRDLGASGLEHLQILANNITVAIMNDRLHRELMSERDRLAAEVIERRKTEERLRESEERHRLLTEYSRDMIFQCTTKGEFAYVSPACRTISGHEPDELIAHHVLAFVHPDEREAMQRALASIVEQPGERTYQFRARRKDGSYIWLETTAELLPGSAGARELEIFGVARDITARKRAEEELQQHRSELARVSRLSSLAQLAAGIAHELNQPLYAIVNYAESGLRAVQTGDAHSNVIIDDFQKVITQAERASAVIRRLRELLRKRPPRRRPADLNELIKGSLELVEPELRLAVVVPELRLGAGLPRIEADRIEIEQVLINLVRNALDSMSETPVHERELTIETRQIDRAAVGLTISDSGAGVPADALERIFDPFYSTKSEGMGLGLSISRAIVETHGGRLWIEPESRRGSVFHISLPASPGGARDVSGRE